MIDSYINKTRGARPNKKDLNMLLLVAKQKFVTSHQLYVYFQSLDPKQVVNKASFGVKLYRYSKKYRLLDDFEYTKVPAGAKFNYYRISNKGVQCLINEGLLPPNWKPYRDKLNTGLEHFLATQEIVVRALAYQNTIGSEYASLTANEFPYVDKENNTVNFLMPDWILKKDNLFLNIEFDNNNESLDVLKSKIENYVKLCKQYPEQQHIVFITLLDDSINLARSVEHHATRIGNIKKAVSFTKDIHISNLDVYVFSLRRVHTAIQKVMDGLQPFTNKIKRVETGTAITSLIRDNANFTYNIEDLDNYLYENQDINYVPDKVVKISNNAGTVSHNVFIIVMEEGKVQDIDRLETITSLVNESRFKIKVDRVLLLYPKTDHRINDIFCGTKYQNVLIGDVEELIEHRDKEPVFYSRITSYVPNMKGVTYEGQPNSYA